MPYIKEADRVELQYREPQSAGELNYIITNLVLDYVANCGKSYSVLNEVVGALECAKLELYRRSVAPYEDTKIAENGDVYQ